MVFLFGVVGWVLACCVVVCCFLWGCLVWYVMFAVMGLVVLVVLVWGGWFVLFWLDCCLSYFVWLCLWFALFDLLLVYGCLGWGWVWALLYCFGCWCFILLFSLALLCLFVVLCFELS